jgi:hypothetical protein
VLDCPIAHRFSHDSHPQPGRGFDQSENDPAECCHQPQCPTPLTMVQAGSCRRVAELHQELRHPKRALVSNHHSPRNRVAQSPSATGARDCGWSCSPRPGVTISTTSGIIKGRKGFERAGIRLFQMILDAENERTVSYRIVTTHSRLLIVLQRAAQNCNASFSTLAAEQSQ